MQRPVDQSRQSFTWLAGLREAICLLIVLVLPLALNPWAQAPFEPVKVTIFWGGVILLGAVTLPQTRWQRWFHPKALGGWLLGFYALSVLWSTLTSLNLTQSLWGNSARHGAFTLWAGVGFCLLLRASITSAKAQARLLLTLLAGSIPLCLYGFVQFAGVDPLTWATDSVSPVLATLGRSNYLAAYLAVLTPFTGYWLFQARARHAMAALLAGLIILLLQLGCLLLTQARAGWLAMSGGVIVFWLGSQWGQPWWRTSLILGGFILFSSTLFNGFDAWRNQIAPSSPLIRTTVAFPEQRRASVERRTIIWRATLPLLTEHWLIGYGPETFVTVFNQRYPPGSLYDGLDAIVDDPHNILLDQAFSLGLFGLLCWCGLVVHFYWRIGKGVMGAATSQRRLFPATLAGAMTAYLIQALFNPDVIVLTVLFWLLLALACGLQRKIEFAL